MSQLTAGHEDYIQTKVNPTLETLVQQVLVERPENPVPFMIQWLATQTKAPTSVLNVAECEQLRTEIKTLQAEVSHMQKRLQSVSGGARGNGASSARGNCPEEEEGEVDDGLDEVDFAKKAGKHQGGISRQGVSEEAYGAWNEAYEFVAPVHEKTQEQREKLDMELKKCILFNTMEQANLETVIDALVQQPVGNKERVLTEGADGDDFFVIIAGYFECFKAIDGKDKLVKSLGPGDYFGELALLYNNPRAFSVDARGKGMLWKLDRSTFNNIIRDSSMKKREMYDSFLKSVPILQSLGPSERSNLADALIKEVFPVGTDVVTQGEPGTRFYIVEEGSLISRKDGAAGTMVASFDTLKYERASYFGELALLRNEVRGTTVTTLTETTLLSVDIETFKTLFGPLEELMRANADQYK